MVTSPNGQIVNMNDCIWDKNFYDKVEKFLEKNVSNSFKVGLFSILQQDLILIHIGMVLTN